MPLPTDARSIIETAVDAMATPPYSFNYGPVNIHDPAAWLPAVPQVFLQESGWTPPGGTSFVDKLMQTTGLTFRAVTPRGAGSIKAELDKVDQDVKRMMASLEVPLRSAGVLFITFLGSTPLPRLVYAWPGEISIRYGLTWRQSRSNPSST